MQHVSTRGQAPEIGFTDALLAGLARDGGLYVPAELPVISPDEIADFAGRPYEHVALRVLSRLIDGDIADRALESMIDEAYAAFRHPATCPLVQIDDNLFVLELFHGPTLAFKDVAMQLIARMMDHVLKARGQRATIVGATSGDTGGAAIEAFKGLDSVDVFILYPHGRVSDVQRRQMTTVDADNVHAIAIEGSFDDAQALVKGMFNHHAFRDEMGLSGVNSINWGRIAAQTVYYFTAAIALGAPHRPVSFTVPTGNFGNVLAGQVARRMGLPIETLHVACNANDIMARVINGGDGTLWNVNLTVSPSMDIQVSSNFERALHEAMGRDEGAVRAVMGNLAQSRAYVLPPAAQAAISRTFSAGAATAAETMSTIRDVHARSGYLLDPHTAVGVHAARPALAARPATPMIVLGTAHPAKFPDAVQNATGVRPALPAHLANLMTKPERIEALPAEPGAIEAHIRRHSRVARTVAA